MTAIVGIYCKDGIVVGADSAATSATAAGMRTVEQPVMKIDVVADMLIIAGTGQIGMGQRFCHQVEELWAAKKFSGRDHFDIAKIITAAARQDYAETGAAQGGYGALVAFPCKTGCHLVEFAVNDLQPEFKTEKIWYVSMGSGQVIIDPFLGLMREVFWTDGPPSVQDAIFATTWALDHAVQVNPGGVNSPVKIATLEKVGPDWRAQILSDDELLEHRTSIEAAKDSMRNYKARIQHEEGAVEIPAAPEDDTAVVEFNSAVPD